jgi:NAD(P)-dependent dehydrogenase (short-subunit alcohol dehydrogenase family)
MMLTGKTAIVTGASRGLGEGIAREMAAQGAAVTLLDILDDAGREIARELTDGGLRARYATCDVTDMAAVTRAVAEARAAHGALDVLVNNAAVALPPTPVTELPEADFLRLLDVNVASVYRFCRATFDGFRADGGGAVINLSSVHQSHSLDGWSAYAASKGAIVSITRQLAAEWGRHNIRVNSISPGAIDATMTREILDRDETGELEGKFARMHALERLGRTEEVAATAAFLASDGAGFITGEDILIDGGLTKVIRQ